jgi:flagellar FliL protein
MQRGAQGGASALAEIGPMFPLDTFTVNLLSESGRRYLKVEMNLELSGEELGLELDNKTAVIRDIIIRLLSSKSLEEISTAKGKEKLKEQIVDQLNMRLRDGRVNNVYFTEFVVQ